MSDLKMTSGINNMNLRKKKEKYCNLKTNHYRKVMPRISHCSAEFAAIQGDPSYVPKMMSSHPYDGVDPSAWG